MELRATGAFSTTTNGHKFPYDAGLYRISKRCMLTDNYNRDTKEWVDEFTTTFYLIKTNPHESNTEIQRTTKSDKQKQRNT